MRFFGILFLSLFGTAVSAQSSEARVEQVGSLNVASIVQFTSLATLAQTGTGHTARIEQTGLSEARITQGGSGNVLAGFSLLTGFADLFSAASQIDASTLLLSQDGTDNQAFVSQAAGSFAQIAQSGAGNRVQIVQSGF